jgi:hypothetical protein
MTEAPQSIGSNNPPLKIQLEEKYPQIFERIKELEIAAKTVPAKIVNEDDAKSAQDLIKMMREAIRTAESTRVEEKKPYDDKASEVHATFKIPMEALDKVMREVIRRHTAFLDEKAAAEEARKREAARLEQEERDRKLREAQEAEDRRKRAEEAERKAKEEAEAAEKRREAAKRDAEEAERRAKAAQEEAERQEARAASLKAKNEADVALIAQVTAERQAHEAKQEVKEASRVADTAFSGAVRADNRAQKLEQSADDKTANSRLRGDLGTVGSLAKRWTYRVVDYNKVPLESLRPFLQRDAIDSAVYRMMQTGVRELPGVIFEQVEEARIA